MNDMLVWIDCEMTGLDLEHDSLVEVAALVTNGELEVQGDGIDIIIHASDEQLASMNDFVTKMHTSSGLIDEIRESHVTMEEAEEAILAYIRTYVPEAGKAPLAGNTIGTDRAFLARQMPNLEGWVHYRNVDVSSIKELAHRWYPKAYYQSPAKNGNHRALADIQESIEELRYYREAIFVPSPGPTSLELKSIAARHQGELTGITIAPEDH